MIPQAEVTLFTKQSAPNDFDGALLSKRIALGPDGRPFSDGSPCRMSSGTAITVAVQDAVALAGLIDSLQASNALALGSIKSGINGTPVQVVTAKKLIELGTAQSVGDSIARTRTHLVYRPRVPAWMLNDLDLKGVPPQVQAHLDMAGGYWEALLQIAPGLANAARVSRASTSAGLFNRNTGERYQGSGGQHDYVLVKDGADIPRALRVLHDRCWLHGCGWYLISGAGQLLERSIVDASVYGSERLVFEGPPDIVPPLMQDRAARACRPVDGSAIDTRVVIPDLTAEEKHAVATLRAAQRQALEPQAQPIRAAADQKLVEDLIARTSMPRANALRQVQARHRGVLGPDIMLTTDHHDTLSVGQMLLDGEKYVSETLCDPLEGPAYGYGKARIMRSRREPDSVFIHSFAHGGATYDLRHDYNSARRVLEAVPVAELGNALCAVVAAADLEEDDIRQLLILCAERAPKIGLRVFTKRLKDDREKREAKQRREADRARREADALDSRIRQELPPTDGELTPVVKLIDRVLSEDKTDNPPMRRPDGSLVEIRVQSPSDMHLLTAGTANADEDVERVEAPPEPLMVSMSETAVTVMIERFIVWEKMDKEGNYLHDARPATPFIKAFAEYKETNLPTLRAIVTAPMVLRNGEVLDGVGLDRSTDLYYSIAPWMRDCIPKGEITEDDVIEATRFLIDEWLIDMLTDMRGKLLFIALCASVIQRHVVRARPGWLIGADLRGGGKTTSGNMAALGPLGRMASAASWSPNPEERRKTLLAMFLEGVALALWDNIPAGTVIDCPHINRALTTALYSDRVLGVSKTGTAPSSTVQVWTCNNGKFGGDMASRGIKIPLTTDDPRPESRKVAHADPFTWTMQNRPRILRSIYTILIGACRNRPADQVARTRFKDWWDVCGWPVERAAELIGVKLDFAEVIAANEETDPDAQSIAALLRFVKQRYGDVERGDEVPDSVRFMPRDLRALLDKAERAQADRLKHGTPPDEKMIEAAADCLDAINGRLKRPQKIPDGRTIGRVLGAIVGRPILLDETGRTIGILRTSTKDGNVRYHVERHDTGGSEPFDDPEADFRPEGLTGREADNEPPWEPAGDDPWEGQL